ncbi:MAG: thioredoxin family protein [Verrucomicrobiaceae bacterium]|nr:thioredoxin family protein [Verrucomicrobiaceae bacterium]
MKTPLLTLLLSALLTLNALAGKSGWEENYEKAIAEAKESKKLVLLDFTGSDWCGWCMKLDEEVFSTSAFKKFAKENLVLVELDYPHGKNQTKKLKEQNASLKSKFGIRGYPTLIVIDADGKEQARWGGYSKTFLSELKEKLGSIKK